MSSKKYLIISYLFTLSLCFAILYYSYLLNETWKQFQQNFPLIKNNKMEVIKINYINIENSALLKQNISNQIIYNNDSTIYHACNFNSENEKFIYNFYKYFFTISLILPINLIDVTNNGKQQIVFFKFTGSKQFTITFHYNKINGEYFIQKIEGLSAFASYIINAIKNS